MITVNRIEKLLISNQFILTKGDIVWGHSDIIQFRRGDELINIQYQREDEEKKVWSVCFDELNLIANKYLEARKPLTKYEGCETIEDFIMLCKFAKKIIIVE